VEEFTTALKKWEEDYKEANGGVAWLSYHLPRRVEGIALHRHSKESDVMLFHLLFPAGTPDVKANVTKGLRAMLPVNEHRKDHSNYMDYH